MTALYRLANDQAEALEFEIKACSQLIGKPLKALELKPNVLIAAVERKRTLIFPDGDDDIRAGDRIIVITTDKTFDDADDLWYKMNRSMLRYIIGRILIIFSLLLLVPAVVALIYREVRVFFSVFRCRAVIWWTGFCFLDGKTDEYKILCKRSLVICAPLGFCFLFWWTADGLAGDVADMVDATFEAASGFTTTGSSILANVDIVSRATVFWRSFSSRWRNGCSRFALAVLPSSGSESVHVMKAEVPDLSSVSLSRSSGRRLVCYAIYLVMTAVLVVLLYLGG